MTTRMSADLDLQVWIASWFLEYITGPGGEILFSIGAVEFMIVPREFSMTRWSTKAYKSAAENTVAAYFFWRFPGDDSFAWKNFHIAANHAELENDIQDADSLRALFEHKLTSSIQWLKIREALNQPTPPQPPQPEETEDQP